MRTSTRFKRPEESLDTTD